MFTYKPGSRVKVEDGEYLGELSNINENVPSKYGACVRFVFRIVGGDYDGTTASVLAKDDWSPGSKLDGIIRALGIEPLDYGSAIDSTTLCNTGKYARIYVESEEKNGNVHNNVTKWKSVKAGTTPPVAPAAPLAPAPAAPAQTKTIVSTQQTVPVSTGVQEVKELPRTPTGVNIVDEINF
jgi:hypothetical protein